MSVGRHLLGLESEGVFRLGWRLRGKNQQIHTSTFILLERLIVLSAGILPLLAESTIYFVYCLNSHSSCKHEQVAQFSVIWMFSVGNNLLNTYILLFSAISADCIVQKLVSSANYMLPNKNNFNRYSACTFFLSVVQDSSFCRSLVYAIRSLRLRMKEASTTDILDWNSS